MLKWRARLSYVRGGVYLSLRHHSFTNFGVRLSDCQIDISESLIPRSTIMPMT